jgi:uncharacterized protein
MAPKPTAAPGPTGPTSRVIEVMAFCRDGSPLQGHWPLAALERLATSLQGPPEPAAQVQWRAQGHLRPVTGGEPEVWLHLQATAEVSLLCQRCLQTMPEALRVDRRFRFVRREDEAERLDEELEDDVLVLPLRLDLVDLLEDELILALPLVPRHPGACPHPLPRAATPEAAADAAPHPFAALAALRRRGGGDGPT